MSNELGRELALIAGLLVALGALLAVLAGGLTWLLWRLF